MRFPRLASETLRGPLRGLISEGGPYPCLDAEESLLGLLIGCQELDRRGPDKESRKLELQKPRPHKPLLLSAHLA